MSLLNFGAFDVSSFCDDMQSMIRIVGYILLVFKIAIPLIIIGLGMFDFGKAVVAEKEEAIKQNTKRLIYRIVAGIAIFLVPNLILWIFKVFVTDYESQAQDFKRCETCLLTPGECN